MFSKQRTGGEPVGSRHSWGAWSYGAPKKPQSKGGILSKACDYVRELRQSNQRLQETFKEAERLQMDNDLLRQQVPGHAPSPAPSFRGDRGAAEIT